MVSANPLVTVIIAAHNSEGTIAETLSSAIASTHDNLEFIVVDDGSIDGTAAIVESAAEKDSRIRLFRRSWGGVSAALNAGLSAARGEYIAHLDADDLWHPTKIAKQVRLAQDNPDVGLIYTFVRSIDQTGRVLHDVPPQRFPRHALCRGIYDCLKGAGSTALIPRRVFEEIGGYDESLGSRQDLLMQLRINARYPIAFVPEYLAGYRATGGSLSSNPAAMLTSWEFVRRRIEELFPEVPAVVLRWANARQYADLAEAFAWRGQSQQAARLLLKAMWCDPLWVSALVSHRSVRRMRRAGKSDEKSAGPIFYDCDPAGRTISGTQGDENLLTALERRRLRLIAQFDERLREAGPERVR